MKNIDIQNSQDSKIKKIAIELEKQLPGEKAQNLMIPKIRYAENIKFSPKNATESAVLLLLFPYKDELSIVFIQRNNDSKHHSGQIAFPGGKEEKTDDSKIETAIREANEEVGVEKKNIKILGKLTPLYIPVSNHNVTPIVGYSNNYPDFIAQKSEVQQIIVISLEKLFSPENKSTKIIHKYNTDFEVPYYNANENHIWGATAMILSEFEQICTTSF